MSHSPTTYILCGLACAWMAAVSWTKPIPYITTDAPLSNSDFRSVATTFRMSVVALVCAWFAISYVGLAHVRRGRRNAFVAFARGFGPPSVKCAIGPLAPDVTAKPKQPRRSAGEERGRVHGGPSEARMVTVLPGGRSWAMAARNLPEEANRLSIMSHTQLWSEANCITLPLPTFFAPVKS